MIDTFTWSQRVATALLVAITASGCATPDMTSFATETASLASAVAAENAMISTRFTQDAGLASVVKPVTISGHPDCTGRNPESLSRHDALVKDAACFKVSRDNLDVILSTAVAYSTSLTDLAAAGETGADAVKSLVASVKSAADTVGVTLPADPALSLAGGIINEFATALTRTEAQNSLSKATAAAAPAVQHVADIVAAIYDPGKGAHANLIVGLEGTEEGLLRDKVGANRIAFYNSMDVKRVPDNNGDTRLEVFFGQVTDQVGQTQDQFICAPAPTKAAKTARGAEGGDKEPCIVGNALQSLQAANTLLTAIEPQVQSYNQDVIDARKWLDDREAAGVAIVTAVQRWAKEHAAVTKQLDACGGIRALRTSCGNLSFANFKLAVARVQAIAGKGDK